PSVSHDRRRRSSQAPGPRARPLPALPLASPQPRSLCDRIQGYTARALGCGAVAATAWNRQRRAQVQERGPAAYIAEFIGTFGLVFAITISVVLFVPAPGMQPGVGE